jgi:hypothetical protein
MRRPWPLALWGLWRHGRQTKKNVVIFGWRGGVNCNEFKLEKTTCKTRFGNFLQLSIPCGLAVNRFALFQLNSPNTLHTYLSPVICYMFRCLLQHLQTDHCVTCSKTVCLLHRCYTVYNVSCFYPSVS